MKSIKSIYKIGNGPSSSHTVGPYNAAKIFGQRYPDADSYCVTLYGSLACTGDGHGTGKAIVNALEGCKILIDSQSQDIEHPNTMVFEAFKGESVIGKLTILSVGGGSLKIVGEESDDEKELYPQKSFAEIMQTCKNENLSISDFIRKMEGPDLYEYLEVVWKAMKETLKNGLEKEGKLPGSLNIERRAKMFLEMGEPGEAPDLKFYRTISAYAYACAEENACEQLVVTAPTCGSCGVIPAVFYYMEENKGATHLQIINALAVAGLIGNIIRTNASISGAECGCQAEIGSACAMAAAGLASIYGLSNDQIEFSAETAMEHNLGLTCDPINGLVQIPCIERNTVAALRAFTSVNMSRFLTASRKISFDDIVETMYRTGKDMDPKYRETSHGGLAAIYGKKSVLVNS